VDHLTREVLALRGQGSNSEMAILKEQMGKVAIVLDQLARAVFTPRESGPKPDMPLADIMPVIEAMKVHIASFPNAMREARRAEAETQKAVAELADRLSTLEQRLALGFPLAEPRQNVECLRAE
jgi:hypothetical protein